jgi:hypothetical protein
MDKNIMVKNKIEADELGEIKKGLYPKPKHIKKMPLIIPFKGESKKLLPERDTIILNEFIQLYFKNKITPTTYTDLIK